MTEDIVGEKSGSERRCAYAGCTTRLSIYNSDFLCWAHADATTRARFERTTARPVADSVRWPARTDAERTSAVRRNADHLSRS
jgi:hypothetical protein